MKVKVQDLESKISKISGKISGFEIEDHELFVLDEEFKVELEVFNTDGMLRFNGSITGDYKYTCSRCLDEFTESKNIALSFIAVEESNSDSFKEGKEDYLTWSKGDEYLELDVFLKEEVIVNAFVKPLCVETCKGLCSGCGKNLNKEKCNCYSTFMDPRWDKLNELKKKMENKED